MAPVAVLPRPVPPARVLRLTTRPEPAVTVRQVPVRRVAAPDVLARWT